MPIQFANSELVARAWLLSLPGIPADKVGTTLPQDVNTWNGPGYVQLTVTGGTPAMENSLRRPVITTTCWATNEGTGRASQTPPWGKACDLAEAIMRGLYALNGEGVSLGVPGAPGARVLQAHILTEPRRSPLPTGSPRAKYILDFSLNWVELP